MIGKCTSVVRPVIQIMSFDKLSLAEPIQQALVEENYGTPTPIQRDAIPVILEGKDLIGCAQTGSGKTAAFALPVLDALSKKPEGVGKFCARTVVLTPTRELANQVAKSFEKYGKHLNLKIAIAVGGMPIHAQIKALSEGLEVLVGTPGRILDLTEQRKLNYKDTEYLILDEVDRMFDMGFIQDVKAIIRGIPETRQTLCFSATLGDSIDKLIQSITKDPVKVSVDIQSQPADQVEQKVCFVKNQDKSDLVCHLILGEAERDPDAKMLIFTGTKQGADHLKHRLGATKVKCEALHGDKPQRMRERVLDKFRTGSNTVLIATDVAARGLDIKGIDLVLNYDIPNESDTYVHRIGRTGRAGRTGNAYTFCAEFDQQAFSAIERVLGKSVEAKIDHPYHNEELYKRYQMLYSLKPGSGTATPRKAKRRNR
jgi:ATP-dependent RNA helicase RhlE